MKNPFSPRDLLQVEKSNALATILFCDMKAYSQVVNSLTQDQAIELLTAYLKVVVNTVEENHGTVSKFIGDAVLAYWLAEENPEHARLACQFASSISERMTAVSNDINIKTQTGIHTGRVTLISLRKGKYRSLEPFGDAVNLASRLEGCCSIYKARAIASEEVINRATGVSGWKDLGAATVKGKVDPVTLYGLM